MGWVRMTSDSTLDVDEMACRGCPGYKRALRGWDPEPPPPSAPLHPGPHAPQRATPWRLRSEYGVGGGVLSELWASVLATFGPVTQPTVIFGTSFPRHPSLYVGPLCKHVPPRHTTNTTTPNSITHQLWGLLAPALVGPTLLPSPPTSAHPHLTPPNPRSAFGLWLGGDVPSQPPS